MNTYHYFHSRSTNVDIPNTSTRANVCVIMSPKGGWDFVVTPYTRLPLNKDYVSNIIQNLPQESITFNILKGALIIDLSFLQVELDELFNSGKTQAQLPLSNTIAMESILRYFGRFK